MVAMIGKTFRDERLAIDNKKFIHCTFTNCVLEYSGEPVSFYATRLSRCKYIFLGPAQRTVLFLQETGLLPYDPAEWGQIEEVAGEKNNQGTSG